MKQNEAMSKIGSYGFLLGLLLAVGSGFIGKTGIVSFGEITSLVMVGISGVLLLIGVILGKYNIEEKEEINFLIAIMTLLVGLTAAVSAFPKGFDVIPGIGMRSILANFGVLLGPAAITVALKKIFRVILK